MLYFSLPKVALPTCQKQTTLIDAEIYLENISEGLEKINYINPNFDMNIDIFFEYLLSIYKKGYDLSEKELVALKDIIVLINDISIPFGKSEQGFLYYKYSINKENSLILDKINKIIYWGSTTVSLGENAL